jgi:hypothetical protein
MVNIHHKPIKIFSLDGDIHSDSAIVRLREEYSKLLITEMKISGYVPRLDIGEDFTIQYNYKKRCFEFKLSIYGVFLGKKKSKWITGIDGTRVVHTQKTRSKEYLSEVA